MGCGKRYSEFCARSSYRFAGEVTYALIQQSGWAWKQPSDATDLIRVIVTQGKGGSLRGYPQPGWFLENFNPITALEDIQFVVVTIYPSLFYDQKTCERAIWTRPMRQRSPHLQPNKRYSGYLAAPQSQTGRQRCTSKWFFLLLLLLTGLLFCTPTRQQRNQKGFNIGP